MLKTCGINNINELFKDISQELSPKSFDLPEGKSELEVCELMERRSRQNFAHLTGFIGGGFYDHFIPSAIDALVMRSEFYTAYTPYQPEVSQGTLQAIYEYQSAICRLTDLDVSNASLYDGGTALYEACQMAVSATGRRRIVVDGGVSPIYRKMLKSYTANLSLEICEVTAVIGPCDRHRLLSCLDDKTAAVVLQNPNFFGTIDDHTDIVEKCHSMGILTIQSTYPIALAVCKTPGAMGFDIATGEGQPLGLPLSFGGPYLGYIAASKALVRKMPGRIVGRTVDTKGRPGFVLTLQAREQHIRREKATSNICSNEAHCALRAHVYLSLMGKQGLTDVAQLCMNKALYASRRLAAVPGVTVISRPPFFNEFVISLPIDAGDCAGRMVEMGFAAGFPLGRYYEGLENCLLVAVTEKRTKQDIGHYVEALEAAICQ